MAISNKHLRVYTIIFDKGNPGEVGPLVYAQNLSRYGSAWNASDMKKEDAGVLLSDGDQLELTPYTVLTFQTGTEKQQEVPFSEVQRREMKHIERRYKITNRLLGCGAYGRVHMAVSMEHKKQLACKIIDIGGLKKRLDRIELGKRTELRAPRPAAEVDVQEEIEKVKYWAERRRETLGIESKLRVYKREVDILKDLHHPNIISLEKVFMSQNTIYIFQELVTAGDLFSFLEYKQFNLSDSETAVIVRQVALAISYLHRNNIVHRDIKPDNVLMTSLSDGARVVLTDFGCARRLEKESSRMKTSMGTLEYTAPEVPQSTSSGSGNGYTKAVDMWSLGCLTVVLLTGGSPFADQETGQYSQNMARNCDLSTLEKEKDWQRVGLSAKDFVRKLLILDEDARMTASQAVSHKWFTNPAYKREFEELYQRAAKQWRPKGYQVVSQQDIEDRVSTNSLTFWRKAGETPLEWPYKPYPHQVHRIIYPGKHPVKQPGKEIFPCVDIEKERRIYPCEEDGGQAPERAGSITFSEMEIADSCQVLSSSEMGAGGDNDKDAVQKVGARLVDSVGLEGSPEQAESNSGPVEETNESRIRMPFSPDAWNDEQKPPERQYQLLDPISVLTRGAKTVVDPLPNPLLMSQLPDPPYLQPLKMGCNGFMPINYQSNKNKNKNKNDDDRVIKDIQLPNPKVHTFASSLAQGIRICEAYKSSENNNHDDGGSSDRDSDINDDDTDDHGKQSSSSPSASPSKIKRSIYDFLEDEDDKVYEEIDDWVSGKKRRIVYGERDGF
ncbi:hypothetical protein EMCG_06043 [[Emmonsia] crescens]|uniref:Protein kinase domain-containing protein n=1 Tax=[Emmonsia] crescens TaxID=73230 RepID=A0A0G2IC91_9EURO|nr:hypothetical protein EMCG_06043 [Emmonsia crescens UAMH 3008]